MDFDLKDEVGAHATALAGADPLAPHSARNTAKTPSGLVNDVAWAIEHGHRERGYHNDDETT